MQRLHFVDAGLALRAADAAERTAQLSEGQAFALVSTRTELGSPRA
jgi:hypothetical protein